MTSLQVENLMTFGDFRLCLDGQRCTVVGPNGAGKSNIVRVVDLVQKAVDSVSEGYGSPRWSAADQVLRSYAAARHHGEPTDRAAVVRLAVELTTAAERGRVGTFVRAAILHTVIQEIRTSDSDARVLLAEWAEREITDERLSALFSGVIVLRHAGMAQVPWEISYEFCLGGAGYLWLLAGPGMSDGIVRADSPAARLSATARQPLAECLLGVPRSGGPPVHLPIPLPGFDLARTCPGAGAAVAEPVVHTGTGIIDQQFTVFRPDAVSLLFARGVVLVEGETELGALPEWFTRYAVSTGGTPPADLDLGFWSVGGDNSFRTYLTVLHALAIPWVVICDGAAFDVEKRQARNPHIFDQVLKAAIDSPTLARFMHRLDTGNRKRVMTRQMFTDERELGEQHGIFTLARGWTTASKATKTAGNESFETFVEAVAPGKLREAEDEVGDSKVRKGRWLGATVPCPPEVAGLYDRLITALGRQGLTH